MALKLYNTLTRKKEDFRPIKDKRVGMYTCGPTVYDYPHIGNFRTYVAEDILKRALLYNGYKVKHVMNITDVGHLTSDADTGEDKMEKGAAREKKTVWQIADFYTNIFMGGLKSLNILAPTILCKATDHIKEQIGMIKALEKKNFTYTIGDGVYFDSSRLKDYGKMAKLDLEGLKVGARIDFVEGKENATDFALWKFSPTDKKRQMEWKSPWGVGFPGWHIECSAMSIKYLGEHFDIHAGGIEHISIHHTNEIAQSEAATGKKFVNYWFHVNHLIINGEKMSKSSGNFYTLDDLIKKGYSVKAIRYFLMSGSYRDQLNLTEDGLKAASVTTDKLMDFLDRLEEYNGTKHNKKVSALIKKAEKNFKDAVNDDLNMPKALASIHDFATDVNKLMSKNEMDKKGASLILKTMTHFDEVLGILKKESKKELEKEIKEAIKKREEARKKKDFKTADNIRAELLKKGIVLEDTKNGIRWRFVK